MTLTMLTHLITLLMSASCSAEVLTWDNCVSETAINNLELKAARENVNVFKYRKKSLWSEYLPSVSAGFGASRGNSNTSTTSDANSYSGSLAVSQNIFSGFQSMGKTREASANLELQEASYRSVSAKVSNDLQTAFAQLLYAQDNVKLTQEIIKRRQDNLSLVELRFEGGMENKGSYLLAKASLEDAQYEHSQALHLLETSRQFLATVLGKRSLAIDVEVSNSMPVHDPEKNVDIEALASQTPEYQMAKSQVKAYEADLTIARSAFYPTLDFTGVTSRQGNTWPLNNNSWLAMLTLSVPLFDGGRDYYSTYSSSSLVSAYSFTQENTDLQLILNLRRTYNSFQDSLVRVNVYKSYVEAAILRAKIARGKYNNGLLSFENWDIIENDLISKQKTAIQTIRDRSIAEANWLMAQGKGVI
jgi:outer membrane protein